MVETLDGVKYYKMAFQCRVEPSKVPIGQEKFMVILTRILTHACSNKHTHTCKPHIHAPRHTHTYNEYLTDTLLKIDAQFVRPYGMLIKEVSCVKSGDGDDDDDYSADNEREGTSCNIS